jgi:formylglycine-generating enzyme required for sulfatase activity
MKNYTGKVPKIGKEFSMVAIKGGEFTMGSPDGESGRKDDEGPQVKVKVDPFWMGAHEVTWDLYMPFMITPEARYKDGAKKQPAPTDTEVDAVSSPTTPYTDMTFGLGQDSYPAISMTEHAALKFCQWLSAQTGEYYRIPTEAEWEYAARAGTSGAYFFGDDASQLSEYAWFVDNSDPEGKGINGTMPIGQKKPNPWGLYDILGNVNEWTLDQHAPDWYTTLAGGAQPAMNPYNKPVTLFPRVARGGGFASTAENCRVAKRRASAESWKKQDPQLPKSIWYHTDAQWLGFRLVRPLNLPSAEEMFTIWNCGVEKK